MLLARQGVALDDSVQTRGNLLATLLKSPAAIGVHRAATAPRWRASTSAPTGARWRSSTTTGRCARVDPATRRRQPPRRGSPASSAARSESTSCGSATTARCSRSPGLQPLVIDAATGRTVTSLPTSQSRFVISVAFSADRRSLIATIDSPSVSLHHGPALRRRERPADRRAARRRPPATNVTLMVAPGGEHVVTTYEGGPDRGPRRAHAAPAAEPAAAAATTAALSPDGRTIVAGGRDGTVRFVDLATGASRPALGRHAGGVVRATFSR